MEGDVLGQWRVIGETVKVTKIYLFFWRVSTIHTPLKLSMNITGFKQGDTVISMLQILSLFPEPFQALMWEG